MPLRSDAGFCEVRHLSTAGNVWKMLQKMLPDKARDGKGKRVPRKICRETGSDEERNGGNGETENCGGDGVVRFFWNIFESPLGFGHLVSPAKRSEPLAGKGKPGLGPCGLIRVYSKGTDRYQQLDTAACMKDMSVFGSCFACLKTCLVCNKSRCLTLGSSRD